MRRIQNPNKSFCIQITEHNGSYMQAVRNVSALAGFVLNAGPILWERISEDRRRPINPPPRVPLVSSWPQRGLHAAWIGHSTVFLSIDGFRILTDPVISNRIGIEIGPIVVGLKRLVYPALPLQLLPQPDLILLSHAHMDHLDRPSLRRLESPKTTVVTAANTSDLLRVRRYRAVHEVRWGESCQVGLAMVRAFEVKHWGARARTDIQRGYNGYLIQAGRYQIVFGGDTAYTDSFRQIRSHKPVDLAIMPIGAYDPWIYAHCNPEQALTMANNAGAEFVLPVHHQTFRLSDEPYGEPIARILRASGSAEHRIPLREIGGEFHLS